jgi:hypothetical protein
MDQQHGLLVQLGVTQFISYLSKILAAMVCKAHTEPKRHLLSLLVLHERILTADLLAIHGRSYDSTYQLCMSAPEAKAVWDLLYSWTGGQLAIVILLGFGLVRHHVNRSCEGGQHQQGVKVLLLSKQHTLVRSTSSFFTTRSQSA